MDDEREEITFRVSISGVEDAADKVNELICKMKEARTLAGELASILEGLHIEV